MIVVADAGPLIALAKINGLGPLFDLYPQLLITLAVYDETIRAGLAFGADDAARLRDEHEAGRLEMRAPALIELPRPARLGAGEAESIRLAIELRGDRLLVDDLQARHAAQANFAAAGVPTLVQGTLGIIVTSAVTGHMSREAALGGVRTGRQLLSVIRARACHAGGPLLVGGMRLLSRLFDRDAVAAKAPVPAVEVHPVHGREFLVLRPHLGVL